MSINQTRQFVPNKKTPIHVITALNYMKTIWGWEDEEMKQGAIKFLEKVLGNIRKNPGNGKMRDLNITKIRKLTKRWKSIPMLILFNAGFQEDMLKGGRMTLDLRDMEQFNEVCDLLENCKLFDPTKEPAKPAPKPKTTAPKTAEDAVAEAVEAMEVEENVTATNDAATENEPKQTDEELAAALQKQEFGGKDAMEEDPEVWDDDMDDLLARIKAEKKAKGLDTLNMKELSGLSKDEKIKLLEEKRAKFRAQKKKNEAAEATERARQQREAVKKQAEMAAKREDYQNKMAIQLKKKQKADNKRRKAAAREKIRKQKEQRKKEREAREAAKRKAAENSAT